MLRRMRDDVTIRRAEPRDLPALGKLGASMVRLHHGFDRERFMAPGSNVEKGYAWFLGTQLAEPDMFVGVAERAGQIVGYVYAGLEPQSWKELRDAAGFVHDLVVDEHARREGIGTRLMEAAAAWLESRGAPRVILWSAAKNEGAQRLFERIGFRRTMVEMTRERKG
jgi:ribosomal protein S18 acetylase RimI-like enzyme